MLGVIDAPIASALAEPPFALATPADLRLFYIHICIGQIKLLKTRVGYQIITSSHKLLKMRVGYEMHQDC